MKSKFITLYILFFNFCLTGQKLEPLGLGLTLNGSVYDISIDDETQSTYIVGDFISIDGKDASNVAVNRNGIWNSVGDSSTIEGRIYCSDFYDGSLYIAGDFTIGTNSKITNLAKLENGEWTHLDINSTNGSIRDLAWHEGELFVLGSFSEINGIRNNGVMKYSNGEWLDSGLDQGTVPKGLLVSEGQLITWGNLYSGDEYNHLISTYANGEWITFKDSSSLFVPSNIRSCVALGNIVHIHTDDRFYSLDINNGEWNYLTDMPDDLEYPLLVKHENRVILVTANIGLFQYVDGSFDTYSITGFNNNFNERIYVVKSANDKLLVGGNFHHWDSKSTSLSHLSQQGITSFGRICSDVSRENAFSYSIANSIVEYNDKYLIGGQFSFADGLYSPNLVYWDENGFTPFEATLPGGVSQIIVFENELYAVPYYTTTIEMGLGSYDLIKYDGEKWIGIELPIDDCKSVSIINDKLFIRRYYSGDIPHYLENGVFKKLSEPPLNDPWDWYDYGHVHDYKDGYLVSVYSWFDGNQIMYQPFDENEWEVLVDSAGFTTAYNDKMYLHNDDYDDILRRLNEDGSIDTLAENIITESPVFFAINGKDYFSAFNGSTYLLGNSSLNYYNSLRVRSSIEVSEGKYLLGLGSISVDHGIERKLLNRICLLTSEPMTVDISRDQNDICEENYVQYWPKTDHANGIYSWEFEGGTPSTSSAVFPMIKYDSVGTYSVKLKATNLDGDSLNVSEETYVVHCQNVSQRENNHDNHMMMGYEYRNGYGIGGFDFSLQDSILSPRYFAQNDMRNGSVVMSDEDGDLQFYTNGISIWNMENQAIEGSECFELDYEIIENFTLEYYVSNQSLLSLPDVKKKNYYHIFNLDPLYVENESWFISKGLSMTTIDMSENNGLGKVVSCKELLIDDILHNSTMQATRHANGQDWWIIVGKYNSDGYYRLLLTEEGIASSELVSWEIDYPTSFSGQSTFSPDGKFFAQTLRDDQEVKLWNFDNSTGELYDYTSYQIITQDFTENPFGCSFSPNSRFLYVSSLTHMRQIDLCDFDNLDVQIIDTWNGSGEFVYPLYFGKQMLTPNEQIIVTPYGNSHQSFGLIKYPNNKGTWCNFQQQSIRINENTRNYANTLSLHPHFRNYESHEGDCYFVSTEDLYETPNFLVYPNPAKSNTVIHFSEVTNGELYDTQGRMIQTFSNTNYLDLYNLQAGIYFIKTDFGSRKVVIQ